MARGLDGGTFAFLLSALVAPCFPKSHELAVYAILRPYWITHLTLKGLKEEATMIEDHNERQGTSVAGILARPDVLSLISGIAVISIIVIPIAASGGSIHGIISTSIWLEFLLFGIFPPLAIIGLLLGIYVMASGRGLRPVALLGMLLNGFPLFMFGAALVAG